MLTRIFRTSLSLLLVSLCILSIVLPASVAFAEIIQPDALDDVQKLEEILSGDDEYVFEPDDSDLYDEEESIDIDLIEPDEPLSEEIEPLLPEVNAAVVSPGPFVAPIPDGRYAMRTLVANKFVVEIAGGSKANNAKTQIFTSNMNMRQWFDFRFDADTGTYTIMNVNSGKYLETQGKAAKGGIDIVQNAKSSSRAQRWFVVADPAHAGRFVIINALSSVNASFGSGIVALDQFKTPYAMTIKGTKFQDGSGVSISKASGAQKQSFALLPFNVSVAPGNAEIEDGIYKITSKIPGSPDLEFRGTANQTGGKLVINPAKNALSQMYMIKKEGDGFYSIRPMISGYALYVPQGNRIAGVGIAQDTYKAAKRQRWAINVNADGSLSFTSRESGLNLAVAGSSTKAGTRVYQWHPSKTAVNQKFSLRAPNKRPIATGYSLITPIQAPKKRMEIAHASRKVGTSIVASKSDGTFPQKFEIHSYGEDVYAFQSLFSGQYLTPSGSNLVQKRGNGSGPTANQMWTVERTFGGYRIINTQTGQAMALTKNSNGTHRIRLASPSSSKSQIFKFPKTTLMPKSKYHYLETPKTLRIQRRVSKTVDGISIVMNKRKSGATSQKWRFTKYSSEYFYIECVETRRVLGIRDNSTANNSPVKLVGKGTAGGKLWRFVHAGDGWYYLQSRSGLYLTLRAGEGSGSSLRASKNITSATQKFRPAQTTYTPPKPPAPAGPVYFGTYIDVNLSTQKMMYIHNGTVVLQSDVVTGKPSTPTPAGEFSVLYKQSPTVLRGADYAAPVSYWMPFTWAGHGLHDATWQPWFGGNRWTFAGSHGCVNLPMWAAADLYWRVGAGTRVSVHW